MHTLKQAKLLPISLFQGIIFNSVLV